MRSELREICGQFVVKTRHKPRISPQRPLLANNKSNSLQLTKGFLNSRSRVRLTPGPPATYIKHWAEQNCGWCIGLLRSVEINSPPFPRQLSAKAVSIPRAKPSAIQFRTAASRKASSTSRPRLARDIQCHFTFMAFPFPSRTLAAPLSYRGVAAGKIHVPFEATPLGVQP